MTDLGRYQVVGPRSYRGHPPGAVFEVRLTRRAEGRAVERGALRLLAVVSDDLIPGSYRLPLGWPTKASLTKHERRTEWQR